MIIYCYIHQKTHKTYHATTKDIDGKIRTYCLDGQRFDVKKEVKTSSSNITVMTRESKRKNHWSDIAKRITTSDGKSLSGREAVQFREEMTKQKYIPPNFDRPQYQRELAKR